MLPLLPAGLSSDIARCDSRVSHLRRWDFSKRVERWFKTYGRCKNPEGLSAMKPVEYQERFARRVIAEIIEQTDELMSPADVDGGDDDAEEGAGGGGGGVGGAPVGPPMVRSVSQFSGERGASVHTLLTIPDAASAPVVTPVRGGSGKFDISSGGVGTSGSGTPPGGGGAH